MEYNNTKEIYSITTEEREYIQIIKVVLCILVIFVHSFRSGIINENYTIFSIQTYDIKKFISHIICSCAVPGFFLISSVLLFKKDFSWKENITKRIRTLLIPYIILNTFWIAFYAVFQNIPQFSKYFSTESTIISTWKLNDWINAYTGINGYPLLYPLWFIKDLFILNIISPVIKKICDKCPVLILSLIILLYVTGYEISYAIISTNAILFFTLGYLIIKYDLHINHMKRINGMILLFFYIAVCILSCILSNSIFSKSILLITNIIGLMIVFKISTIIKTKLKDRIVKIATYTFSVYLLHEFSLTILIKISNKIIPQNYIVDLIEYFLFPCVILVYCIIISIVLKKFIPKIYSIITGNRAI